MSIDDSILDYFTQGIPDYYPTMYRDGYKPWQIMAAATKDNHSIDDLVRFHQANDKAAKQVINLKGQVTINGRKV